MNSDIQDRRKPRRKQQTIKAIIDANFVAIQTGIVCAVVFFIAGIIFGLKFGGGHRDVAPGIGGDHTGRITSGADTIRDWNDLERATPAERQRHYEGVADRANQSGMRYNVTPKDIQEGVEAFYED